MNDGFDDEQDVSQPLHEITSRIPELDARQRAIYQGLKDIGEEIAAYYVDGIRILQSENLGTAASLLAHVAREIDGGLRDILAENIEEVLEFKIHTPDDETLEFKKKREDTFDFSINTPGTVELTYKNIPRHKVSILQSLGIDNPSPLAERWIDVTRNFAKFAHRHGAWRAPRKIEDFEGLWFDFERVLDSLVGSYLNLLSRLDRICAAEPTPERIGVLRNLLRSEAMGSYFFRKLDSPIWLESLKEDGWFDPDQNPTLQENPDHPGSFYYPIWHALEYVAKVSNYPENPIGTLANIVNAIINYTNNNGERIENDQTDLQIIKIIGALPIDRLELQHVAFMGVALKSKWKYGLVDQEISQTILPKLLNSGERELILTLLTIMLEVESIEPNLRTVMNDYWLEIALKAQAQAIANLCGIEATQIALENIRTIVVANRFVLDFIERVESDLSRLSHPNYAELIVSFTSALFRFAEPHSIEQTVQVLLQDPYAIIRRIAVKAIADHYSNLKYLFWEWEGNPLDEIELKPEIYQLIQTNSSTFDEDEMERMLQWIESTEN